MLFSILRCQSARHSFKYSTQQPARLFFQNTASRTFFRSARCLRQEASTEVPSFREAVKRSQPQESFSDKVGGPRIRNQVLFAAFGSLFAFTYAASRTDIETEYWKKRLTSMSSSWSFQSITSTDLKRVQNAELIRQLREWFARFNARLQEMPGLMRPWIGLAFVSVLQPYADASEGKRICWKICLFNAAIYLAWKIRKWQPSMRVRFMHNPLSGLSYTLLTSMFSHKNFFHLLLNCLALESFGSAAYFYLMREQGKAEPPMLESTAAFHFLAFFISAGLFSGLVSHVATAKFLYPRMVKQLSSVSRSPPKVDTWATAVANSSNAALNVAKEAVPRILPSLGASGAIYATVTLTALAYPNSQVALFIPPTHPVNIQYAVGGLVVLDAMGIIRGWRMFDHWAHLGGAAFGVLYYAYGPEFWNSLRRTFHIEPSSIPRS